MIIDEQYYINTYKGRVSDVDALTKYIYQAEATVDYFTFGRLKNLTEVPTSAKLAVCELIDLYDNYESKRLKMDSTEARISSETVGSHSVSFKYNDEIFKFGDIDTWKKKSEYEIVSKYLMTSGLMYRGVYDYR